MSASMSPLSANWGVRGTISLQALVAGLTKRQAVNFSKGISHRTVEELLIPASFVDAFDRKLILFCLVCPSPSTVFRVLGNRMW